MAESFGIGFVIGASLSSSLSRAFGSVNNKLKETQKSLGETSKKAKILERALALEDKRDALVAQFKLTGDEKVKKQLALVAQKYREAKTDALGYAKGVKDLQTAYKNFSQEADKLQLKKNRLSFLQEERRTRDRLKSELMAQVPSALVMAVPVKMAIDFESSMADVKKVTNFDDMGFKTFSNDLLEMSTRLPIAASGLAEIAAAAGQAGIAQKDLLTFTEDAAKMGTAFDMSAGEAGNAMAGLRAIFKVNQDEVRLLGDSMNALSNTFNAKASEMVNFANRAGGTASLYKMTGQEVSALGAAFLNAKVGAEEASTATNSMLSKLGRADSLPKNAQKAFEALGLSGEEMSRMFKEDAQGALLTFLETAKNSDDPMRYLGAIFGEEHAPKIAKLVNGLEDYKKALNMISEEHKYAGSMEEEFLARSATTKDNLQRLQNAFASVGVVLGTTLLPVITNLVQECTPAIASIAQFASENENLVKWLMMGATGFVVGRMAMTGFGMVLSSVRSLTTGAKIAMDAFSFTQKLLTKRTKVLALGQKTLAVGTKALGAMYTFLAKSQTFLAAKTFLVSTAAKAWTAAQWLLNVALSANPIGLVITGIGALVGWFAYAYNKAGSLGGAFSLMWDQLKAVVPVLNLVESVFSGTVQFIKDLWNGVSLYDAGVKLISSLGDGIMSMWDAVVTPIKDFASWIGLGDDELTEQLSETENKMKASVPPKTVAEDMALIHEEKRERQKNYSGTTGASGARQTETANYEYADISPLFLSEPSSYTQENIQNTQTSMNAPISANFTFTLNGVDDAQFANRVIQSIEQKKNRIETILNEIVNNQVRLSYGR